MASFSTVELIKQHEGAVPYMYRDTKGNVTIGVGYLIPSVQAALKLPFIHEKNFKLATQTEIQAEYEKISRLPFGQNITARRFKEYTKLILNDFIINRLLILMIEEKESQLAKKIPIKSYPLAVQVVLVEMAYNLGSEGLFRKFPKFIQAISNGNWMEASKECRSRNVNEHRNQMRATLLQTVNDFAKKSKV